jgi:hypothetical protein
MEEKFAKARLVIEERGTRVATRRQALPDVVTCSAHSTQHAPGRGANRVVRLSSVVCVRGRFRHGDRQEIGEHSVQVHSVGAVDGWPEAA